MDNDTWPDPHTGEQAGQHDHDFHALAARVAELEAALHGLQDADLLQVELALGPKKVKAIGAARAALAKGQA